MTLPPNTEFDQLELDDNTTAQLDALGITPQQAYDLYRSTNFDVRNPTEEIKSKSGLESYGIEDVFGTYLPDATREQREAQFATYVLGGYIKYLVEDVPQRERYVSQVTNNRNQLEGFFNGLNEQAQEILTEIPQEYSLLVTDNLNQIAQGGSVTTRSAFAQASGVNPLDVRTGGLFGQTESEARFAQVATADPQTFSDTDSYLQYELGAIKSLYPDLGNNFTSSEFDNFITLDEEHQFLANTEPSTFEIYSTVAEARSQRLLDIVSAPAETVAELILEGGSLQIQQGLPEDNIYTRYNRIVSTADPRYSTYNEFLAANPIVRGRTRVGLEGELEVFGIDNQTIAEFAFDPYNLVPLPIIDDAARYGIDAARIVSGFTARNTARGFRGVGRHIIRPASRKASDVGAEVSRLISAGGAAALNKVQTLIRSGRPLTTPSPEISPLVNTTENVEGLTGAFQQLNGEYGTALANRLLAPEGEAAANLSRTDRRVLQAAFDYSSPSEATYPTALRAALPTLADPDRRTLQAAFQGTPRRWQDEAAEAFGRWNQGETVDPDASVIFQKVDRTYTELNTFVRQRGYGTSNELFRGIRTGEAYSVSGSSDASRVATGDSAYARDVNSSTQVNSRYEIREEASLLSTNDTIAGGRSYPVNPDYPRSLRSGSVNPEEVGDISRNFAPERVVNTDDTIRGGPPAITRDGTILDGNQVVAALRTQGTDIDGYRNYLSSNLDQFGLNKSALEGFESPVLVRTVVDPNDYARAARLAESRYLNEISSIEEISDGARSFKSEDLTRLGSELTEVQRLAADVGTIPNNQDLSALLRSPASKDTVRRLANNLIPEAKRGELLNAQGGLNVEGVEYIRGVLEASIADPLIQNQARFIDRFVVNADRLPVALAGVREGISNAIPDLINVKALASNGIIDDQLNILNELFDALDWLYQNGADELAKSAARESTQHSSLARLIGFTLRSNRQSPSRIRQALADYAQIVQRELSGIGNDFKIKERNAVDYWHQAILDSGTSLSRRDLISYETLLRASKLERGISTPTQPTLALGDINDTSIVGRQAFGETRAHQQAAVDTFGSVPATQELLERIGITSKDKFKRSNERILEALQRGRITREESVQATISAHLNNLRTRDAVKLNRARQAATYFEGADGSASQVFANDPVKSGLRGIFQIIEAEAAVTPEGVLSQFQRILGYVGDNVEVRVGSQATGEEVVPLQRLIEIGRAFDTGSVKVDKALELSRELLQLLGIKPTVAGFVARRINQGVDSAVLHINSAITEATDFVARTAESYRIDLNDYDTVEPILRALYDGSDIPEELGEGYKLVYDLFNKLIEFRQRVIKSGTSRLFRYTTKDNDEWIKRNAYFDEHFFVSHWFPISWERVGGEVAEEITEDLARELSEEGVETLVELSRRRNDIPAEGLRRPRPQEPTPSNVTITRQPGRSLGARPSSFRSRIPGFADKTFDEIKALGFMPKTHNPLDLFRDGTLDTTKTLHLAIWKQELIQKGLIIPVKRADIVDGKLTQEAATNVICQRAANFVG